MLRRDRALLPLLMELLAHMASLRASSASPSLDLQRIPVNCSFSSDLTLCALINGPREFGMNGSLDVWITPLMWRGPFTWRLLTAR